MHTPNHHRPADPDPTRVAIAVVVAGQREILDRLRLLAGLTSAAIILLVFIAVATVVW